MAPLLAAAEWFKRQLGRAATVFMIVAAVLIGFAIRDCSADREAAATALALGTAQSDLTVAKNKTISVEKLLKTEVLKNEDLANQLATMKAKPAEIRYVIKSTGVLVPADPQQIIVVKPAQAAPPHRFTLGDGLVVADFDSKPAPEGGFEYTYKTHELTYDTSIVVTDRATSIDVHVSSSADPNHRVRVVQETRALEIPKPEEKLLRVQLAVGATAALGPIPELLGSLTLPWLHPHRAVDVLTPRVSGNDRNFMFGIDAVTYNIGDPIPVFDNIWIGAGANVDIHGRFSGALTLGAKL